MQTADFNVGDFNQANQREQDKGLLVKFEIRPRENKEETLKEGRPIFKDVEYVDIKIPGQRGGGACRPCTPADKKRFPDHYRAFKDRTADDGEMVGTPLTEWAMVSRSQAEELAFFHVKTVEQLALMADSQVSQFMGMIPVREKAKQWLARAKQEKPFLEMDEKLKAQADEIETLKESLSSLMEQITDPDEKLNEAQTKRKLTRSLKAAKAKVK